jgi:hypothetical protein
MPPAKRKRIISYHQYQNRVNTYTLKLCEQCGEVLTSKSAFSRHKLTVHHIEDTERLLNCWPCGMQFKRRDSYHRHEKSLQHHRKLEDYLIPATDACQDPMYIPELTSTENWYSQIAQIDDIPPTPQYNYDEKQLLEAPIEIPLDTWLPQKDPRMNKANFKNTVLSTENTTTINMDELLQMFPETPTTTNPSSWPWTNKSLLQLDAEAEKTTESFLDYLNRELTLADIQADVHAQDAPMITPLSSPNRDETSDFFDFSIMDLLTEDTWITIDAIGKHIDEHNFIPPTDFNT